MTKSSFVKSLAVMAQVLILIPAPGLTRTPATPPQTAKPSASSPVQGDIYASAFSGITYTDEQQIAIRKIRQDLAARKSAVLKEDKLSQDQKDAMLNGYNRMEYILIYKNLTNEQKKQVSARIRALRASDRATQKAPSLP